MAQFQQVVKPIAIGVEWLGDRHLAKAIKGSARAAKWDNKLGLPICSQSKLDWDADIRDRASLEEDIIGIGVREITQQEVFLCSQANLRNAEGLRCSS